MSKHHKIFCTRCQWLWLGPTLTIMRYVLYFWFCRWITFYVVYGEAMAKGCQSAGGKTEIGRPSAPTLTALPLADWHPSTVSLTGGKACYSPLPRLTLVMATLCNRAGHYIFVLWFLLLLSIFLFFFSSPNLSSRIACLPCFYTRCGPSANLECRSKMCRTRLAGNAGPNQSPKNRHLGTIAQLCWVISSQLRHVSTIRKKLVKQQCLPHMSSQYGELRPTSGWDLLASFGHPSTFQRVSRLGSVTARHSSRGRQPNFAALNKGRHL